MNMQAHILAALHEQLKQWDDRLSELSEAQATAPTQPGGWSWQDTVGHLAAWQQRSLARLEAGRLGEEPHFPAWCAGLDFNDEGSLEAINERIYNLYHAQPWDAVHTAWREGYRRVLESAAAIPEEHLLDSSRYAWLEPNPLADVLLGTYAHHVEHDTTAGS